MLHPRPRRALVIAAACLVATGTALAAFTDITPTASPWVTIPEEDFWVDATAVADADCDGDLDIVMLGYHVVYNVSAEHRLSLFLNEGPDGSGRWTFTESPQPLGSLWSSAPDVAWHDIDGDGDPDLVVGTAQTMALYRNDGGSLVLTDTVLAAYSEDTAGTSAFDLRSITWADYDNDGDADLLVPSVFDSVAFEYTTKLLRNDGPNGTGGWTFTDVAAAFDPTVHAQSSWADDDGDGDLDLFLADMNNLAETGFIRRFRNDGGAFVGADVLPLRPHLGTVDRGDHDGDGDLDIIVAGNFQEQDGTYATALRLYRNDAGTYVPVDIPGNWLDYNGAVFADSDSDGDLDLLVTGSFVGPVEIEGRTTIYENRSGVFADTGLDLPSPFSSTGGGGAFTWFDVDGDGDLDYFMTGSWYVPGGAGLVETKLHLHRNDGLGSNLAPPAPGNLRSWPSGSNVTFAWDPPPDDHTAAPGLTYDLRVRPLGAPTITGLRLPEPGNVGAVTSWHLDGLADGSYEWTVVAVDGALAGGPAARGTFAIGSAPPPPPAVGDGRLTQPFLLAKRDAAGATLALSWDTASCPAQAYHLVHGFGSQLPSTPGGTFGLAGSECGVASPHDWSGSPSPAGDRARLLWVLVVATDGGDVEGSWGLDSRGIERVGPLVDGASGACGVASRNLASTCGR